MSIHTPTLSFHVADSKTKPVKGIQENSTREGTEILGEGNILMAALEKMESFHQIKVESNRVISPEGSLALKIVIQVFNQTESFPSVD